MDVSEHRLRNVYLEPFRTAVDAGVASVMASLNTVAGRPMHAHRQLLTDVLKTEWGLWGPVVGDAEAVVNLIDHGVAEDVHDALVLSLSAGLDVEMGGNVIAPDGSTSIRRGEIADERINDAVRRVLTMKARLGLFDDPYVNVNAEALSPTREARAAARQAAERSMVLLKNDGTLPLKAGPLRVLVVGPYAESTDHSGAWVMSFGQETSDTIAGALSTVRDDILVTSLPGASFFGSQPELQDAVRDVARHHDVVIVTVGEPSSLSGEASSRSDLRLPGDQEDLIEVVAASGTPFAVVMMNGRPLVTRDWIDKAPTVLEAWHLGTEAPAAIARILVGEVNPAGRLPMSFPRSNGQVPIYYAHENTGRPARTGGVLDQAAIDIGLVGPNNVDDRYTSKYRDLPLGPEFDFGHGLSYSQFRYDDVEVSDPGVTLGFLADGQKFSVSAVVTNTSARDGEEVVQVYVRDVVASVAQPVRRLCAFRRVLIGAGEKVLVSFDLGWDELGFWLTGGGEPEFVVEPGRFEIHIGGSVAETTPVSLVVG